MEFKHMLLNLKNSNRFNRTSLTKDILVNIRHVNKTELGEILDLLNNTIEMEFKVKLISFLNAYLLFNNTNRDVIIKHSSLYGTLSKILERGLPRKTAITLNFFTTLLYVEEGYGSRGKTLTLHAQNLIRSSGCLSAMTHLFTSSMLHTDTWSALCRCLAEVCRGCELNQNFCSHIVPLCIQRHLQGNPDVTPVLQGLLFNHKRNINLFMESDGLEIFNRKTMLRSAACLQLLTHVIQNTEAIKISIIKDRYQIYENLQDLVKMYSVNSNILQWTTIALYYFDAKLRENDASYNATNNNLKNADVDTDVNNTQTLLQNIMTEILSHRSKIDISGTNTFADMFKTPNACNEKPQSSMMNSGSNMLAHLFKTPNAFNKNYIPPVNKETESNNKAKSLKDKESAHSHNSVVLPNENLTLSFLMNRSMEFDELNVATSIDQNSKPNKTISKTKQSQSKCDYRQFCNSMKSYNIECESIRDFKPTFVSTPKRTTSKVQSFSLNKNLSAKSFVINKAKAKKQPVTKKLTKTVSVPQQSEKNKHRSISSRLLEAINESCTTVIKSVKSVFTKKTDTPQQNTTNKIYDTTQNQKPNCSYSFTNYMRKREMDLLAHNTNTELSSELNTVSSVNICKTCDDTALLEQKQANDEHLKLTVKKLKLGINLYGCDFKRISKTMWPRESYMTPNVLYNLYRKLLLK